MTGEKHAQTGFLNTLCLMKTLHFSFGKFLQFFLTGRKFLSSPWLLKPPASCITCKGRFAVLCSHVPFARSRDLSSSAQITALLAALLQPASLLLAALGNFQHDDDL